MKRTVLLIEDNVQNRYLTTFLLERHGFPVVSAPDGLPGLELAETLRPDLQLPRMDGYTVARALRRIAPLQHTPMIAVTSYAMVGDREKSLAAGCNGYVEKPIDPDTFVSEIQRFIPPPPTAARP